MMERSSRKLPIDFVTSLSVDDCRSRLRTQFKQERDNKRTPWWMWWLRKQRFDFEIYLMGTVVHDNSTDDGKRGEGVYGFEVAHGRRDWATFHLRGYLKPQPDGTTLVLGSFNYDYVFYIFNGFAALNLLRLMFAPSGGLLPALLLLGAVGLTWKAVGDRKQTLNTLVTSILSPRATPGSRVEAFHQRGRN